MQGTVFCDKCHGVAEFLYTYHNNKTNVHKDVYICNVCGHENTIPISKKQPVRNRKYVVGSRQTPIGPAGLAVWLLDVSGFVREGHMIGIKRHNDTIVWVRDNDKEAQRLEKDHAAMLKSHRRSMELYAEHLQEQQHGKRK